MLKFSIPLADFPGAVVEAQRSLYKEQNGHMVLEVEGAVPVSRLNEFRDNNIALTKERDDLKKQWEGFSIDEVKELIAKREEIKNSKAKTPEEVQRLLDERLAAVNTANKAALDKLTAERDAHASELAKLKIDSMVSQDVAKLGAIPGALPDIERRARDVFKLVDGKVVAMGPDGKQLFSAKDGSPLSITEWAAGLTKEAPYFFNPSGGAGSGGGNQQGQKGGGAYNGTNPFKKESHNLTTQQQLYRGDYDTYKRLANEAGVEALPPPAERK